MLNIMQFNITKLTETFRFGFKSLINRFPLAVFLITLQFIIISYVILKGDFFVGIQRTEYFLIVGSISLYALIIQSITTQFLSEKYNWSNKNNILINILLIILNIGLIITFLYNDYINFEVFRGGFTSGTYRMLIYILLSAILLITLPFIKDENDNYWWNFTLNSAFKLAISYAYSIVLYGGVAIALGALEQFWDIKLSDHQFEILAVFSFIFFFPIYFLSNVDKIEYKEKFEIPKYLEIFGKFILIPLIIVYVAILYPYMYSFPFKDIWPSNQSTFIILATLILIYAVMYIFWGLSKEDKNYKFVNVFIKISNVLAIPTIIFWIYSLSLRIKEYGITVNRYMLMFIILWFLLMSLYFVFSKVREIKGVLLTFFIMVSISFYVPFTAFYHSQKSQINRFIEIAASNNIYNEDVVIKGGKEEIEYSDEQMIDTLVYLNNFHSLKEVSKYLDKSIKDELNINEFGYSFKLRNRYDINSPLFFVELKEVSPNITKNRYVNIIMDKGFTLIPSGSIEYRFTDQSGTTIDYNKDVAVIDGIEFKISIDLLSPNLIVSNDNYLLTATDPSLLTFFSGDYVFVANSVGMELKDNRISEIQYISGIIFKK